MRANSSNQKTETEDKMETESGWDVDLEVSNMEESPPEQKPGEGAKDILPGILLVKTGKPVYIPETQDIGVMTEDMIREQEEIFSKLGTNEEAQKIRQRMQAASLYSDMQAFKAANLEATLEDFVKWHSPKDWIQSEDSVGQLSQRMQQEDNIWKQMWEDAPAIPARKQKSLFDATTQAEKVLHYLGTMPPRELLKPLIVVAMSTIYENFRSSVLSQLSPVGQLLNSLEKCLSQKNWIEQGSKEVSDAFQELEILVSKIIALETKFPESGDEFILQLLSSEAQIQELDKSQFQKLFFSPGKVVNPDVREFILRSKVSNSETKFHRLYALLSDYEFRLSTSLVINNK